ncbi:guanylate kinase [Corynebacterium poyangense]|uniref:Guanylate kinase n=1 Tax=Corynebacterium poyangense TaxID=2684405 RepID=A0A7H0SP20_9CORY|nr:guanylate kinase [Corynebacterium poyangense]MBZ8177858.1 guanylate kinase [Corynebacterium poyangense]QNQ90295.1 guanylate kinase [Corynebacterium poyangense]
MTSGEQSRGQLVVLVGPSAVGKSTVVHQLRQNIEDLYFSVSMTTRAPRPHEEEGIDYFFVSLDQFQHEIDNGGMLEWADIHGGLQRSGTPAAPVNQALQEGRPVLVEVDVVGARAIKSLMPEATTVFLAPPSWEELVQRLTGRGTETAEVIERRLATARNELAARDEFDQIVVNDDVNQAVASISDILLKENS